MEVLWRALVTGDLSAGADRIVLCCDSVCREGRKAEVGVASCAPAATR